MPIKLLLATTNKGKAKELSAVASEFGIELVVPDEKLEVLEDGTTYFENAFKKASAYSKKFGLPSLADDSGLEVDVLQGRPGIHSARYGGEGLSDQERCEKLLEEVAGRPSAARFRCVVLVAKGEEVVSSSEGLLAGRVLTELRGGGGFGYDPIIEIDGLSKTLAEITPQKNFEIGFRVNAARTVFEEIMRMPL